MMLACELIPALAFEDAEELLVQEIEAAQHDGLEVTEVVARAHLAESQVRAGRWAESLASAQTALEHARQAAPGQIVAGASSALAMVQALLGQHDIARDISSLVLTTAEASDDFWFSIAHRSVLGLVALAEVRPQEAIEVLGPAWQLMLERNLGDLSLFPVAPVLGECLVMVGRLDDAAALCDALADSPVGDQPWSRMTLNRTHALVASARGDHAAAVDRVTASMDTFSQVPEPFEQARTMLIAARVERAARNWGAARARLVDALERFDLLGAARWSDLTAADIARLPGRHPGDKRALTAREREVCALAVDGLTNKEIAARLVVSVGTVEANLSKAYAKLGVRSRTELAARWIGSGSRSS